MFPSDWIPLSAFLSDIRIHIRSIEHEEIHRAEMSARKLVSDSCAWKFSSGI